MNDASGVIPTRIIKLGGSLLVWDHWQPAFLGWLESQVKANNLLVVGGGRLVEELRRLDGQVGLGQLPCHLIAIGLMRVTAASVAANLGVDMVHPLERLEPLQIVDVECALRDVEFCRLAGGVQPAHWSVTSDSLSAWIAGGVCAEELVLLKSRDSTGTSLEDWVRDGLVDDFFSTAASELPSVRCVNLRSHDSLVKS